MGVQQRINGLFSEEPRELPPASSEESGLRPRPRPTVRDSMPDLSDQAVELPDEDDLLDDVRPSDTIPPSRLRAALREQPPALPVPLSRKTAPALPLPLTRRSRTSLAELSESVPASRHDGNEDDGRIDLDEVARLARTSPPPAWDDAPGVPLASELVRSTARRARRRAIVRAAGLLVGAVALIGAGFVAARLGSETGEQPVAVVTTPAVAQEPAPIVEAAPVVPAAVLEEQATEPVRLEQFVVEATAPRGTRRAIAAPVGAETEVAPEHDEASEAEATDPEPETAVESDVESAPAEEEPPAALPETPSREQVLEAVRPIEGAVRGCAAEGDYGVVPVRITVASSGRVTTAVVTGGSVLGTPAGSCIARAVRGARFPAFQADRFVVEYPFQL